MLRDVLLRYGEIKELLWVFVALFTGHLTQQRFNRYSKW
jgi:hypothetical protein